MAQQRHMYALADEKIGEIAEGVEFFDSQLAFQKERQAREAKDTMLPCKFSNCTFTDDDFNKMGDMFDSDLFSRKEINYNLRIKDSPTLP